MNKIKVAIYIRVSTDAQSENYGEELQLDKVKSFINFREDLELAGENFIFMDVVSGASEIDSRPEFKKLMDYAELGEDCPFQTIIVYRLDRLARRLILLLDIVDKLNKNKIGFISATENIDTTSPFGKAMLAIIGVFAELERETIKERTHAGRLQAQIDCVALKPPYGYDKDENKRLIVNPETSENLKQIFRLFVEQDFSISQIQKFLKDEKILNPANYSNHHTTGISKSAYHRNDKKLRDTLSNIVYTGKYYFNKTKNGVKLPKEEWVLSKNTHEALISEEIYNKALEKLQNKKEYHKSDTNYLLSGLVECDCCKEHRIKGMTKREGYSGKYYQCSGKDKNKFPNYPCSTIPLSKDLLETFVINKIQHLLLNPEKIEELLKNNEFNGKLIKSLNSKLDKVIKDIEKINNAFENIKIMFENSDITHSEYELKMINNRKKYNELVTQKARLQGEIKGKVSTSQYMKTIKFIKKINSSKLSDLINKPDELKRMLGLIIEKVVIHSREANVSDKLTGRKRNDGLPIMVPHHIQIILKLPEELLIGFANKEILKGIDKEQIVKSNSDSETIKEIDIIKNDETKNSYYEIDLRSIYNISGIKEKINNLYSLGSKFGEDVNNEIIEMLSNLCYDLHYIGISDREMLKKQLIVINSTCPLIFWLDFILLIIDLFLYLKGSH